LRLGCNALQLTPNDIERATEIIPAGRNAKDLPKRSTDAPGNSYTSDAGLILIL
jgi:hypothetical protein